MNQHPTQRWLIDLEDELQFSFTIPRVICADGGTYALEARNSWGCSTLYATVRVRNFYLFAFSTKFTHHLACLKVRETECPWDNKGAYPFDDLYCKKFCLSQRKSPTRQCAYYLLKRVLGFMGCEDLVTRRVLTERERERKPTRERQYTAKSSHANRKTH